jgi:DNA-binding CsgD family transcriptional regulator
MECARLGSSVRQPGGLGVTGLTPRQEEVVRLASAGLSSKEIARRLGIAKRTVDGYFSEARKRTGAKTRIELVAATATRIEPQAENGSCPKNRSFPDKITHTGRRGRPSVVTPDVIDVIRELRPAHTLKAIAEKLGISRSTLYAHMHEIAD